MPESYGDKLAARLKRAVARLMRETCDDISDADRREALAELDEELDREEALERERICEGLSREERTE